ncbi:phage tail protein, partial [Oenococcus oeni]
MATVGLKLVQFGLIDDTGKIVAGTSGLSTSGLYQV